MQLKWWHKGYRPAHDIVIDLLTKHKEEGTRTRRTRYTAINHASMEWPWQREHRMDKSTAWSKSHYVGRMQNGHWEWCHLRCDFRKKVSCLWDWSYSVCMQDSIIHTTPRIFLFHYKIGHGKKPLLSCGVGILCACGEASSIGSTFSFPLPGRSWIDESYGYRAE